MHTRPLLLAALLAGFLSPAHADDDAPAPPAHPRVEIVGAHDVRIQQGLRNALRGQDRVVKNAPYSAQAVSERLQQLADGNQIERRTRTASYRDSAGTHPGAGIPGVVGSAKATAALMLSGR